MANKPWRLWEGLSRWANKLSCAFYQSILLLFEIDGWLLRFRSLVLDLGQKRKQSNAILSQPGFAKGYRERCIVSKLRLQEVLSVEEIDMVETSIVCFCQWKRFSRWDNQFAERGQGLVEQLCQMRQNIPLQYTGLWTLHFWLYLTGHGGLNHMLLKGEHQEWNCLLTTLRQWIVYSLLFMSLCNQLGKPDTPGYRSLSSKTFFLGWCCSLMLAALPQLLYTQLA